MFSPHDSRASENASVHGYRDFAARVIVILVVIIRRGAAVNTDGRNHSPTSGSRLSALTPPRTFWRFGLLDGRSTTYRHDYVMGGGVGSSRCFVTPSSLFVRSFLCGRSYTEWQEWQAYASHIICSNWFMICFVGLSDCVNTWSAFLNFEG